MNRHFQDARYYLKRAGENAKKGIAEELAPIEERVRELTGREKESEPGRLEKVRADLKDVQERAGGEAKEAIGGARQKLKSVRESRAS